MRTKDVSPRDVNALLETFAAELADAAIPVALRHRQGETSVDLELDLWRTLAETVRTKGCKLLRAAAANRVGVC